MRSKHFALLLLSHLLNANFFAPSWLPQFVCRNTLFLITYASIILNRLTIEKDDIEVGQNMSLAFAFIITVELVLYINLRANAQLFIQVKMSEQS